MLDIKQQKVAQENTAEESGFTEVSGLEVRMHLGKVNGRDMACLFSLLLVLGQQHTQLRRPGCMRPTGLPGVPSLSTMSERHNCWTLGDELAVSTPLIFSTRARAVPHCWVQLDLSNDVHTFSSLKGYRGVSSD